MHDFSEMSRRHRTQERSALPDVYVRARDLETRKLVDKTIALAGRDASPELLREIAAGIVEAAAQKGGRQ